MLDLALRFEVPLPLVIGESTSMGSSSSSTGPLRIDTPAPPACFPADLSISLSTLLDMWSSDTAEQLVCDSRSKVNRCVKLPFSTRAQLVEDEELIALKRLLPCWPWALPLVLARGISSESDAMLRVLK